MAQAGPEVQTDALEGFTGRLRDVLDERGLSQAELARSLGVGQATVSEWFTRGRVPSGTVLLRLPEVLSVNGHWLLTGEGSRVVVPEEQGETRVVSDVLDEILDLCDQVRRRYGIGHDGRRRR